MGLERGAGWSCPFPPEADADKVDIAVVRLWITVRADGTPSDAAIVDDPGHGFGRAARECAMARRYRPALDRNGVPILSSHLVNVRFSR
jgi:protein TonB